MTGGQLTYPAAPSWNLTVSVCAAGGGSFTQSGGVDMPYLPQPNVQGYNVLAIAPYAGSVGAYTLRAAPVKRHLGGWQ